MSLTLRDALIAAAPILIGAALVFGPLGAWLANRRTRNPAVWLVLAAITGPIGLALLLIAPPGRCRACGEPTVGFRPDCVVCGARARTGARVAAPAVGVPVLAPAALPDVAAHAAPRDPPARRRARAAAEPGPDDAPVPIRSRRSSSRSLAADGERLASVGARRPLPATPTPATAAAALAPGSIREGMSILAIGVFVQGTESLLPGARYLLARTIDDLVIIGPLEPGSNHAELHLPLDGVEATSLPGRLVVSGWTVGRSRRWALGFQALSGLTSTQIDEALTAPLVPTVEPSALRS
jgi:hypothetical protein